MRWKLKAGPMLKWTFTGVAAMMAAAWLVSGFYFACAVRGDFRIDVQKGYLTVYGLTGSNEPIGYSVRRADVPPRWIWRFHLGLRRFPPYWTFSMPLWLASAVFVPPAAPLWWDDVRACLRRRRVACTECGYDRRGLVARAPCPECGAVPTM